MGRRVMVASAPGLASHFIVEFIYAFGIPAEDVRGAGDINVQRIVDRFIPC